MTYYGGNSSAGISSAVPAAWFADALQGDDAAADADPSGSTPYRSLQAAVDRIRREGVAGREYGIKLTSGVYDAPVVMALDRLAIRGEGPASILRGTDYGLCVCHRSRVIVSDVRLESAAEDASAVKVYGKGSWAALRDVEIGGSGREALFASHEAELATLGHIRVDGVYQALVDLSCKAYWSHGAGAAVEIEEIGDQYAVVRIFSKGTRVSVFGQIHCTKPHPYGVLLPGTITDVDKAILIGGDRIPAGTAGWVYTGQPA